MQTAKESQRLSGEVKNAKASLQHLKQNIESRQSHCLLEINPRIEQLEAKMEVYCHSAAKGNDLAWADLELEKDLLNDSRNVIDHLEIQVEDVEAKM